MNDFQVWFVTGYKHILDIDGYDHILYVVTLSILFSYLDWKKLFYLVTAFTIGHTITLVLSVFNIIKFPTSWIELGIALTIMSTSILNIRDVYKKKSDISPRYLMATAFGCIHGLGFSIMLKSLLGHQENIVFPLFYFNLGLEAGQVVILVFVLFCKYILSYFMGPKEKRLTTTITFVILLMSLYLFIQRLLVYA